MGNKFLPIPNFHKIHNIDVLNYTKFQLLEKIITFFYLLVRTIPE